ncbi:unnamed protein product [Anisakis simplex]|uniref:G_PROTEIN_RECEP_F1_2 domain-containing protein n=1 Tax=Anisakis simplex TaxID=6269 RepID=A0A0M3J559_ANISI|nr:unnamed protein product [Anisakis simplex]
MPYYLEILMIILELIMMKFKARTVSRQALSLRRYEIRVLIQAMTISFFIGFVTLNWYNFDTFLLSTKWNFFIVNSMWILNCGINPILYIILNKFVLVLLIVTFVIIVIIVIIAVIIWIITVRSFGPCKIVTPTRFRAVFTVHFLYVMRMDS